MTPTPPPSATKQAKLQLQLQLQSPSRTTSPKWRANPTPTPTPTTNTANPTPTATINANTQQQPTITPFQSQSTVSSLLHLRPLALKYRPLAHAISLLHPWLPSPLPTRSTRLILSRLPTYTSTAFLRTSKPNNSTRSLRTVALLLVNCPITHRMSAFMSFFTH
ncbi:hypothetical protein M422DRAFT_33032 [Sphaerobolus stellatus SS14]|uniref:Uncharacterized protein n=1 Tax=Sphaerobolus stellatus (strain SS14) TaxID=990650 RepID=A0A0C9VB71_SPHS4|nr:hypothetical protein M422DRAFT_33032 [Sphaerobolus stellatus SS14]